MRWLQTEYILKGIFLGLLLAVALLLGQRDLVGVPAYLTLGACLLGGLLLALLVATGIKWRQGYRLQGPLLPFILFLLLESPTLVYAGILAGTIGSWLLLRGDEVLSPGAAELVAGGAVLGVVFGLLRQVQEQRFRLGLSLLLAAGLLLGAGYWFNMLEWLPNPTPYRLNNAEAFAIVMLLGMPLFYLLTFVGSEEESEVEIGVICAGLGLGLSILLQGTQVKNLGVLIAVGLFFGYTMRIMPSLRVFKHALRGMSYARAGRPRRALLAFRRALQHDPNNVLAREGFWQVHVNLDLKTLHDDPQTLALVDFGLCLERAGALLIEPSPSAAQLDEAVRLLKLVVSERPHMKPRADYWRAVACTHQGQLDEASTILSALLDPQTPLDADMRPERQLILRQAWQLALLLHPGLHDHVGMPQLALPGRRMEAIAVLEQYVQENPDDGSIVPLKRLLYQDLTEEEYRAACSKDQPLTAFDYAYAEHLGRGLINDPKDWLRGASYLRIAAHGQPARAPGICVQIAQACQRAGDQEQALRNYEEAKKFGRMLGQQTLADDDRVAYFTALKYLGEQAVKRGDTDAAIENFQLYSEWERSGIETLRTLAGLYEDRGDALSALRVTDRALVYDGKDKDLLARKDRYYYSVEPEQLKAKLESVAGGFDIDYCLRKARGVLDSPQFDLDTLDWAQHLLNLALLVKPERRMTRLLLARALRNRGEIEEAVKLLEEIRTPKPEKFEGDDEEAWYLTCQLLGELYLSNLGRADLAIPCLNDFRKSTKSGARTYLRLGQAYEQVGDRERAVKCYHQVTAYEGNPLTAEAQDALDRLGAS